MNMLDIDAINLAAVGDVGRASGFVQKCEIGRAVTQAASNRQTDRPIGRRLHRPMSGIEMERVCPAAVGRIRPVGVHVGKGVVGALATREVIADATCYNVIAGAVFDDDVAAAPGVDRQMFDSGKIHRVAG